MRMGSLFALICTLLICGTAHAAEIKVISTRATEEIYRELVPKFELATGNKVTTVFTGTADLKKRIAAGERYDVIVMIDEAIDAYIESGLVVPGSRVDIARSVIGAGIHAGLPKPDIGSVESFKAAVLAAKSIGYSTGPSGEYLLGVFKRLGIADAVKPKLMQVPSVRLVGSAIASGEVELGFQQTNELSHFPGVDYLGPLPPELQEATRRSGGIMTGSKVIDEAKALLKFLSGPQAAPVIRKHGLEPV
jgi:molybdate transport system substrate-binding protein